MAGTEYVSLSIATLLLQYHQVTVIDVIFEKVNSLIINNHLSNTST